MAACSLRSSNRSRLISRVSLFCGRSTYVILSVGMPISDRITASISYVNENGVSLLLDFIIKQSTGGYIVSRTVLEWIVLELLSVIRDDFSWKSESATDNVVPYEFFDLIACNRYLQKGEKRSKKEQNQKRD
ncbi:hypothetical protein Tco_0126101 [Tanacetum coccineum]